MMMMRMMMMMMRGRVKWAPGGLMLVLWLGAAGPEVAAQSLAERLERSRDVSRAQLALVEDRAVRGYLIVVQRRGEELILTGRVPSSAARDRAAAVVRDAVPHLSVHNQIQVAADARRAPGPLPPRIRREAEGEVAQQRDEQPPPEPRTAEPQPAEPQPVYHTVQRGDTLIAIARRHGTTVAEIQRLNNLRGTNIRPGQRLRVR